MKSDKKNKKIKGSKTILKRHKTAMEIAFEKAKKSRKHNK